MSLEARIIALAQAVAADIKALLAWKAAPVIAAGSIDGTPVGTNVRSTGAFTSLSATGRISATVDQTTPTDGAAYFYKAATGATLSGYQVVIETGGAGARTTKATLDNNGNLLIGTTSNPDGNKLNILDTSSFGLGVYRNVNVIVSGPAGECISLGALDGATQTAAVRIIGVLENPATAGYLALLTRTGGVLTEKVRIASAGNVGIGTTSPSTKLHVNTGAAGYAVTIAASSQTATTYQFGIDSGSNFAIYDSTAAAQRITLSNAGHVGIGVTPGQWVSGSSARCLQIGANNASSAFVYGDGNQQILGTNAYYSSGWKYGSAGAASYYELAVGRHTWKTTVAGTAGGAITWAELMSTPATATTGGANGSACVLSMYKESTTSRSINAAGTINAAGADYAEYERNNGAKITKGDLVGFGADGTLTLEYAGAVRFGVKSTNPSIVGGDVWGTADQVGLRPLPPVFAEPVYNGVADPGPSPQAPVALSEIASDEQRTAHESAMAAHEQELAAHADRLFAYRLDQATHCARVDVARSLFDTAIYPRYERALSEFEARLEAARQGVDRIAYCGKVPCNVLGTTPGDYIVPAPTDTGAICGQAVPEAEITFAQYRQAVGRVNRLLPDGRAEIVVLVH